MACTVSKSAFYYAGFKNWPGTCLVKVSDVLIVRRNCQGIDWALALPIRKVVILVVIWNLSWYGARPI